MPKTTERVDERKLNDFLQKVTVAVMQAKAKLGRLNDDADTLSRLVDQGRATLGQISDLQARTREIMAKLQDETTEGIENLEKQFYGFEEYLEDLRVELRKRRAA